MVDGLLLSNDLVVDDLNQPGETIGSRRRTSPHNLAKIYVCAYNFIDLIKDTTPGRTFIDNKGRIFNYTKTVYGKVHSKYIVDLEQKDIASIVSLKDCPIKFIINHPPTKGERWAEVLYLGNFPLGIVDLSTEYKAPYKKKV